MPPASRAAERARAPPSPASVPGDTDGNGLPDFCDIVGDVMAWAIGDDTVVQGGAPIDAGADAGAGPQRDVGRARPRATRSSAS